MSTGAFVQGNGTNWTREGMDQVASKKRDYIEESESMIDSDQGEKEFSTVKSTKAKKQRGHYYENDSGEEEEYVQRSRRKGKRPMPRGRIIATNTKQKSNSNFDSDTDSIFSEEKVYVLLSSKKQDSDIGSDTGSTFSDGADEGCKKNKLPPTYPLTVHMLFHKESTVARAIPERRWDPILFLPVSNLSRHRLVKWRMHWLPSFPLKDCRCGKKSANRDHFIKDCLLLAPMIEQLFHSFKPRSEVENIPPTHTIIDTILNNLLNSPNFKHGHWRKTWPILFYVLRDIDICSHPNEIFAPEPDQSHALIEYLIPPSDDED